MNDVAKFLEKCDRNAGALTPVKSAWAAFNSSLPKGRAGAYSRDRFLGALISAGYEIGELDGRSHICGLALPGAGWRVKDGQALMEVA